jgi:hypothetical protein
MGTRGMHIGYLWQIQKERGHYEDLDIGWRMIFKWILRETKWGGMGCIHLAQIGTNGGLL